MFTLIRRSSNYISKRHLHDRKLPSVKLPKKTTTKLIGTQSPKKADHQLNKKIEETIKDNKDNKDKK